MLKTFGILALLSIGIIMVAFIQFDGFSFLSEVVRVLLYCLFGSVILHGIIFSIRKRRSLSNNQKVRWALFLAIATLFVFIIQYAVMTDGRKMRLLTATSFRHQLQLFDDGRFKLLSTHVMGGSYSRGNYHWLGDTLRLEGQNVTVFAPYLDLFIVKIGSKKCLTLGDSLYPDTLTVGNFFLFQ